MHETISNPPPLGQYKQMEDMVNLKPVQLLQKLKWELVMPTIE